MVSDRITQVIGEVLDAHGALMRASERGSDTAPESNRWNAAMLDLGLLYDSLMPCEVCGNVDCVCTTPEQAERAMHTAQQAERLRALAAEQRKR